MEVFTYTHEPYSVLIAVLKFLLHMYYQRFTYLYSFGNFPRQIKNCTLHQKKSSNISYIYCINKHMDCIWVQPHSNKTVCAAIHNYKCKTMIKWINNIQSVHTCTSIYIIVFLPYFQHTCVDLSQHLLLHHQA